MTSYKVTFRCNDCGHVFKRTLHKIDAPDPKCPHCLKEQRTRGMDMAGRPPAIGGSIIGKAVDTTAEIVMQDHGLPDLKDNIRQGEISAPKLAPHLQRQVDNFFGGSAALRGTGIRGAAALGQRALSGAFRSPDQPDILGGTHAARARPRVNVVASDRKE